MSNEKIKCPVCGSDNAKNICIDGTPISKGQYDIEIFPVMCECSMVYLSPRWSKLKYQEYYTKSYDDKYRLEIKSDVGAEGVKKNAEEILLRLKRKLSFEKSMNILDVGSGYGIGLKHYKKKIPNAKIFGIESFLEGIRILKEEMGGILVTDDFDNKNWTIKNTSKFDLIILRHVFEHLLNPNDGLKLKTVLNKNGMIYLAVPDMLHPRIKLRDYDEWTNYWFRVVHPYYYNRYTLGKILIENGFDIIDYSEENCELWMIIGLSTHINKNKEFKIDMSEISEKQIDVFDRYLDNFSLSK